MSFSGNHLSFSNCRVTINCYSFPFRKLDLSSFLDETYSPMEVISDEKKS